ncbi:hypothetical protein [Amorphus orientalis]|uniref:Uncharacterized protein n=1 Tax=Amorphus orientalis TaxID=649198 RepID=A0AAE4AQE1_9HYPH|nr:hypothetical protein [Amorphus orientalis]MDQ0313976.1 hypothetical protein [Amorphus orientalis]
MLGVDLVRIQKNLRRTAENRQAALSEVVDESGSIESFVREISADFRENYYDEGLSIPIRGTFDYEAAEYSHNEMKGAISNVADNLVVVARLMAASIEEDRKTASMSLIISYTGLALIIVGFALQIASYFA